MSKYVKSCISLVLLICALVCFFNARGDTIIAGAGNGTNAQVKTLEEFYSLLDFVSNRKDADEDGENIAAENIFITPLSEEAEEQLKTHKSVTIIENSSMSVKAEHKKAVGYDQNTGSMRYEKIGDSSTTLKRSLTVYMTESASFYVSKGTVSYSYENRSSSENAQESSSYFMDFDLQIYFDEEKALVNFKELTFFQSELDEIQKIKSDYKGKWIELPKAFAGEFLETIDSYNRDFLGALKTYIEDSLTDGDNGDFTKDGDIYSCKKEQSMGSGDAVQTTEIEINLSNPQNPFTEFKVSGKENTSNSIFMLDTLGFSNIDNTVINGDIAADFVINSTEDLENIFE